MVSGLSKGNTWFFTQCLLSREFWLTLSLTHRVILIRHPKVLLLTQLTSNWSPYFVFLMYSGIIASHFALIYCI